MRDQLAFPPFTVLYPVSASTAGNKLIVNYDFNFRRGRSVMTVIIAITVAVIFAVIAGLYATGKNK